MCRRFGGPLALTSANVSGGISSLVVGEFRELWGSCDLVVDGGTVGEEGGRGSTIVDVRMPGAYEVLRTGCALEKVLAVMEEYGLTGRA